MLNLFFECGPSFQKHASPIELATQVRYTWGLMFRTLTNLSSMSRRQWKKTWKGESYANPGKRESVGVLRPEIIVEHLEFFIQLLRAYAKVYGLFPKLGKNRLCLDEMEVGLWNFISDLSERKL